MPEPVALEWAEHAITAAVSASKEYASAVRRATNALVPMASATELEPRQEEARLLERLANAHAGLKILSLDPEDAKEALIDQVLQRSPGKRKPQAADGVKTGAADSASVRCLHRASAAADDYVVISGDKDWPGAFAANGWPVPTTFKSWTEMRRELFSISKAADAVPGLVHFIHEAILSGEGLYLDAIAGGGRLWEYLDDDGHARPQVAAPVLSQITRLCGLSNVELVAESKELLATVFMLADVRVEVTTYDPVSGQGKKQSVEVADALLRGRLNFATRDQQLHEAHVEDAPVTVAGAGQDNYSDDDAVLAVLEALSTVPGLEGVEEADVDDGWNGATTNGTVVTVERGSGGPDSDAQWEIDVTVGESPASYFSISCYYDYGAWVGGQDGMHLYPPYSLLYGSKGGANPEWRLAADVVASAFRLTQAGR